MLRLLTDEDFDNDILRGVLRRKNGIDIAHVQDSEVVGRSDEKVLAWAAMHGRIILTYECQHNVSRSVFTRP